MVDVLFKSSLSNSQSTAMYNVENVKLKYPLN